MSVPHFMFTSPEMADYMIQALGMLRRGESIEGFAVKHKAEWKRREEARTATPAAVLPFADNDPGKR